MGGMRSLTALGFVLVISACASQPRPSQRPDVTYAPMEAAALAEAMGCAGAIGRSTQGFTAEWSATRATLTFQSRNRPGPFKTTEYLFFNGMGGNSGRYVPASSTKVYGEGGLTRQPPSIEVVRVRQMVEKQCFQPRATDP